LSRPLGASTLVLCSINQNCFWKGFGDGSELSACQKGHPVGGTALEGETLRDWSPKSSGSRIKNVLDRGCVFLVCLTAGILGLVIGWSLGFYCWVAQQLFVLAIALDLFPFLNKLPGISYIHRGFRRLLKFYRRAPRLRDPTAVMVRAVPFLGWFIMVQEARVMAALILLGLPLDLLLQILTSNVWQIPDWGWDGWMDFGVSFAFQAFMTFLYTPYLALFVVAFRWNQEHEGSQLDSSSVSESTNIGKCSFREQHMTTNTDPTSNRRFNEEGDGIAQQFFSPIDLRMPPEEYAARGAHLIGCFTLHLYQYRDPALGAWVRRLGEILFTEGEVERCRQQFLTPDELATVRKEEAEGF
jgi:hypothetical protein